MAKGLRSKSMRKNRSLLRATVSGPLAVKRQEELYDALKQNIEQKKSTTSLMSLKKLMPTTAGSKEVAKNTAEVEEMEEEDDDEEEEEEEVKVQPKKSKKANPFKKEKVVKAARPKKELVWFK